MLLPVTHVSLLFSRIRRHAPVFARFLVSGGLGASVDFGTLLLCTRVLNWPPATALLLSGSLALLTVFLCNKYFTFRLHETKARSEAWKFLLVYGNSALMNYLISLCLIHFLAVPEFIGKAVAVVSLLGLNYVFLRGFVFKPGKAGSGDVILP